MRAGHSTTAHSAWEGDRDAQGPDAPLSTTHAHLGPPPLSRTQPHGMASLDIRVTDRSNAWEFGTEDWWAPTRGVRLPRGETGVIARCSALQVARPGSVICRCTAADVWGCAVTSRDCPIHAVMSPESEGLRREGHRRIRGSISPTDITRHCGLAITTPERTFVDIAHEVPLALVVAFGDHILRHQLATRGDIDECLARSRGQRGVRRARQAAGLLDPRSESPPESILRVTLIAAGLPAPIPQVVIRSAAGTFIARGDLVYEDERIVIEYDGEHHLTPEQQAKDADRRHRLALEGWLVITLTRYDLRDPRRAVRKVEDAISQRRTRKLPPPPPSGQLLSQPTRVGSSTTARSARKMRA